MVAALQKSKILSGVGAFIQMSLVMVINAEMSAKLYCMKEPISMRTTKREGKPEVPSDVSTIKRFFFSDTLH